MEEKFQKLISKAYGAAKTSEENLDKMEELEKCEDIIKIKADIIKM